MSIQVTTQNTHLLKIKEIRSFFNDNSIPDISVIQRKECLLTPTKHCFSNYRFIKTGYIKPHDNRKLSIIKQLYLLGKYIFSPKLKINLPIIWPFDDWSSNYYHWLCDVLPRILHIKNITGINTILLPHNYLKNKVITKSLELLAINYITFEEGYYVKAKTMVLPITSPAWGILIPSIVNESKNAILKSLDLKHDYSKSVKIYISRKLANKRIITNEDELIPHLRSHSYKIVYAEELSFIEQIKLFANCRSLITLHGAGETNMQFMPSGSRILEIRNGKMISQPLCYLELANICDHKWNYIIGEDVGDANNYSDIYVNPDSFKTYIDEYELQS